jgi:uncharacterized membrane protein
MNFVSKFLVAFDHVRRKDIFLAQRCILLIAVQYGYTKLRKTDLKVRVGIFSLRIDASVIHVEREQFFRKGLKRQLV